MTIAEQVIRAAVVFLAASNFRGDYQGMIWFW